MTARLRRHPVVAAPIAVALVPAAVWGVKLAQVARSVGANAQYWSEPRGEPGGLLYVALLADRLRESTGRPAQVVNLSSSGARSRRTTR